MSRLELVVNGEVLTAELLPDDAPESVAAVKDFLPLESELMHVRWSGIEIGRAHV